MEKQSVEAQRKVLTETFPDFMKVTENVLFGQIWSRPGLSPRDRSLITVAALVAMKSPNELAFHIPRALSNGVTKDEVKELLLHLAFYAGWPASVTASHAALDILKD